ncbi:MAG: GNAT family N-acetyltransferase [Sporichthyaceae bacterium]
MILRLADPTDPAELAAVGELTLAAYDHDGWLGDAEDGYRAHLRDAAGRARDAELAVALGEDATLLGTVTFCRAGSPWAEVSAPSEAEFRMLAVAPTARGRGVGHRLTAWCLDRARAEGCAAIVLSTLPAMAAAHRLYERLDFRRTPDRDWEPAPGVHLITYRLDL